MFKIVYQVTAVHMHLATRTHMNDITGPAIRLISYVSSQWHTVVSSYTPGNCIGVNPFYNGVLYSLQKKGFYLGWQNTTNLD